MKLEEAKMQINKVELVFTEGHLTALEEDSIAEATASKWSRISLEDYFSFYEGFDAYEILDLLNQFATSSAQEMFEATLKKKGALQAAAITVTQLEVPSRYKGSEEFSKVLEASIMDGLAALKVQDPANVFVDIMTNPETQGTYKMFSLRKSSAAALLRSIKGAFTAKYGRWTTAISE